MDHLLDEERVSLTKVAQEFDVHVCTMWRWVRRGIKGICLESFTIGGKRFTTREAVARFILRTNSKPSDQSVSVYGSPLSKRRLREIEAAEKFLDEELGPRRAKRERSKTK